MKERWLAPADGAAQKQEDSFAAWYAAEGILFKDAAAQETYKKQVQRIKTVVQLDKVPDRIPVCPSTGHFPIEYAGIDWYEAMYDYGKLADAWRKYYRDFKVDAFASPRGILPGKALEEVDFKLYQWAGKGLSKEQEYQFVEKEYMRADEYQDLIDDPTGFFLNTYFPRIFGNLEALAAFPSLVPVHEIPMVPPFVAPFADEGMKKAFAAMGAAGEEVAVWSRAMGEVTMEIMGSGLPSFSGGLAKAPFDVLGDSLRGTRSIMLDMFRHKDEIKEACERLVPFMIKMGISNCKGSRHLMPYLPLHKGADGFMSNAQFKEFYWPSLRKVIIGLIDAGLVPILFAEGGYNERLEIISDLPKGKCVWHFDATDMEKAKKTVGQVCCIAGNVPLDLLCTAGKGDVIEYSKNLIKVAGKDGGFIFTTGGGMQGSKPENIHAMLDTAYQYGVYS